MVTIPMPAMHAKDQGIIREEIIHLAEIAAEQDQQVVQHAKARDLYCISTIKEKPQRFIAMSAMVAVDIIALPALEREKFMSGEHLNVINAKDQAKNKICCLSFIVYRVQ